MSRSRVIAWWEEQGVRVLLGSPAELADQLAVLWPGSQNIFLPNAQWREVDWQELWRQCQATSPAVRGLMVEAKGWVWLPTGGSSGRLRLVTHSRQSMRSAVRRMQEYWGVQPINSLNVLPMYHVSGLMPWVRAWETGGVCRNIAYEDLKRGVFPLVPESAQLSLVPTQLHALCVHSEQAFDWLRQFTRIFVGGAALSGLVKECIVGEALPVVAVYGATETAAMVAVSVSVEVERPMVYQALPGVSCSDVDGVLQLSTSSLFGGYWGEEDMGLSRDSWSTADRVRWQEEGFELLGRVDQVIISGGEKVFVAEVEAKIMEALGLSSVFLVGQADAHWGECVVCCYLAEAEEKVQAGRLQLAEVLTAFEMPKRWLALEQWPLLASGKIDRMALQEQCHLPQ